MRETRLEQQDERTYQEGGGSLGTEAEASGGITEAEPCHIWCIVAYTIDSHSRILQDTALGTDGLSGWREQVLASANANHAKQVRFRVYMPSP